VPGEPVASERVNVIAIHRKGNDVEAEYRIGRCRYRCRVIGLGADNSDGFGTRQIIGTIAGVLVVVVGLAMAYAPWFLGPKE
jgi:hypothetical protein